MKNKKRQKVKEVVEHVHVITITTENKIDEAMKERMSVGLENRSAARNARREELERAIREEERERKEREERERQRLERERDELTRKRELERQKRLKEMEEEAERRRKATEEENRKLEEENSVKSDDFVRFLAKKPL